MFRLSCEFHSHEQFSIYIVSKLQSFLFHSNGTKKHEKFLQNFTHEAQTRARWQTHDWKSTDVITTSDCAFYMFSFEILALSPCNIDVVVLWITHFHFPVHFINEIPHEKWTIIAQSIYNEWLISNTARGNRDPFAGNGIDRRNDDTSKLSSNNWICH